MTDSRARPGRSVDRGVQGTPDLPIRLRDHWVVVRCRRPGETLDRHLAPGAGALARWLHGAAFSWTDPHRTTLVAVVGEGPACWHEAGGGVTVARGQIRWCGRSWDDPTRWAARLWERWPSRPYGHPLAGTVGDATAVCVDAHGRGVVAADEFGAASAYHHLSDDLLVAGSRPALVAEVLELLGRAVAPDLLGLAWLVRSGYQVANHTAHEGIVRLPMGARIALTGRHGVTVVEQPTPWCDTSGFAALGVEAVLDVAQEAIADHLTAASALGRRIVLDLTGGKDSRLVLAVALSVLDRDAFLLRTVGPDEAPDVQVAREIADRLGLEHQSGYPRLRTPGAFADHAESFLTATDGMQSLWVASVPHPFEPEVRVSGVSGEMLRVGMYESPAVDAGPGRWAPAAAEAAAVVEAMYDRGLPVDIVTPDVRRRLHDDLVAYFDHLVAIGTPADQLLVRYMASYHNRVVTGELLEVEADHRVLPLVDARGVRALGALPQEVRYREPVHVGLIRRLAPELLHHRLANGAWRDAAVVGEVRSPASPSAPAGSPRGPAAQPSPAGPGPSPGAGATASPASPASTPPAPAWPVMALAKAGPNVERQAYLAGALADPPAAVWDLVDRDAVDGLLASFDEIAMKPRKQLYAAATVARWLERSRTGRSAT